MNDKNSSDGPTAYERIGDRVSFFRQGGVWYANHQRDGRQTRQSLRTRSKKEACRLALRLEGELGQDGTARPAAPPTIDEVIDAYQDALKVEGRAAKTLSKYEEVLERVRTLANRRHAGTILDLNRPFLDAYRAERRNAEVADKTLYTESVIVRQVVNFALSRWNLSTDPLKGLKLKKPKPRQQPC